MYDMKDFYLMSFKNYKECADYFETSPETIRSMIYHLETGKQKKVRDYNHQKWVKLVRVYIND